MKADKIIMAMTENFLLKTKRKMLELKYYGGYITKKRILVVKDGEKR
jgi:hypothetical protein